MKMKWLLLSNIFYVLMQWLVLSLLSKFYSLSDVGEYFFALAFCTPVMLFFALKLGAYVVACSEDKFVPEKIRFIRLFYSGSGLFVLTAVYLAFFRDGFSPAAFLFVALFKLTEQFDDAEAAMLSRRFNFKAFALIKMRRGTAYISVVLFAILVTESFHAALYLALALYLIYWLIFNAARLKTLRRTSFAELKEIFVKMWPMGGSGALQSLGISGSRMFIGITIGKGLLAVFGSISYAVTAVNIVTDALCNYFMPYFSKCKTNRHDFFKTVKTSQSIVFVLAVILLFTVYFLGEWLLRIAFTQEVARYHPGLLILCVNAAFKSSTSLLGTAIISTEKYTYQMLTTNVGLAALVALIFVLKPYGIYGIFYATLGASVIEWGLMATLALRYFKRFFEPEMESVVAE